MRTFRYGEKLQHKTLTCEVNIQKDRTFRSSDQVHLFPVLLIFNGIHSTAGLGQEGEVKLGILTEAAGIAQEWIFLIIVDGSNREYMDKKV